MPETKPTPTTAWMQSWISKAAHLTTWLLVSMLIFCDTDKVTLAQYANIWHPSWGSDDANFYSTLSWRCLPNCDSFRVTEDGDGVEHRFDVKDKHCDHAEPDDLKIQSKNLQRRSKKTSYYQKARPKLSCSRENATGSSKANIRHAWKMGFSTTNK